MNRLSPVLFCTLLIVLAFLTLNSIGDLPEIFAVNLGGGGAADGWTTRDDYRSLILLFLLGLPLLLVWLMAGLPRFTSGRGQVPNCEYWFAQERRHSTERFLMAHSCWLGCLTVAVVYGMHISILRANAITPQRWLSIVSS
jgi:uncharacterized membrane protein